MLSRLGQRYRAGSTRCSRQSASSYHSVLCTASSHAAASLNAQGLPRHEAEESRERQTQASLLDSGSGDYSASILGDDTLELEQVLESIYADQVKRGMPGPRSSSALSRHAEAFCSNKASIKPPLALSSDSSVTVEPVSSLLAPLLPSPSSPPLPAYTHLRSFFKRWAKKPPDSTLSADHRTSRILWNSMTSFRDYAPVLLALIQNGRVELAERVFDAAEKALGHAEILSSLTAAIPNMFIQAYLDHPSGAPQIDRAYRWYMKFEQYHLKPDGLTYAFLLRVSLKLDDDHFTSSKLLVNEMGLLGIRPATILESGLFVDEALRLFRQVCREMELPIEPPHGAAPAEESKHAFSSSSSSCSFSPSPLVLFPDIASPALSTPTSTSSASISSVALTLPVRHTDSESRLAAGPDEAAIGVQTIKRSLRALEAFAMDPYQAQLRLERDCVEASKEKYMDHLKTLTSISGVSYSRLHKLGALFEHWCSIFEGILGQRSSEASHPVDAVETLFALNCLKFDKVSRLTLMHFLKVSNYSPEFEGFVYTRLCIDIAESLEREVFAENILKKKFLTKSGLAYDKIQECFSSEKLLDIKMRKVYERLESDVEALQSGWIPKWTLHSKIKVGAFLVQIVCDRLRIDPKEHNFIPKRHAVAQHAFKHEIINDGKKKCGIVKINPVLYEALIFTPDNPFVVPVAQPMLVPPKLWLTYNSGGYLSFRSVCVRMKEDPFQLSFIKMADSQGALRQLLTGLDILGKAAWTVNSKVLKVVVEAWNRNLAVADMPQFVNVDVSYRPRESFPGPEEFLQHVRTVRKQIRDKMNTHSIRCDTYYKLEIASKLDGRVFYFPHNVDFRGRAYPMPSHFNHIGNDLCRGLLTFHRARPLGASGLRWLKIHIANLYGFDKASLDEREHFTDAHMADIMDSADQPLEGRQWWVKAEDPWQCLAACYDLTAALRSPDPLLFESRIPIHQDGSCNGLQHYAAIGRDLLGATKVNLHPSHTPQDVYAAVAEVVSSFIDKDAAEAHELAVLLKGKISRKVVKQPVMTTVYGVTYYGASRQVKSKLEGLVPEEMEMKCSGYIVNLIFKSLGTIFDKARALQSWLMEASHEIVCAVPLRFALKYGYDPSVASLEPSSGFSGIRLKTWNPVHEAAAEHKKEGQAERSVEQQAVTSPRMPSDDMSLESQHDEHNNRSLAALLEPEPEVHSDQARARKSETHGSDSYPQTLMMWTTPLGFPIAQPYRAHHQVQLKTAMQTVTVHVADEHLSPVTISKQVAGFPPNFIHSLDACHMFMTAAASYEAGLVFASVHDSFWTHAADVDRLNEILREKFVELHEKPIMEDLRNELIERYEGYKIPVLIPVPTGKEKPQAKPRSKARAKTDAKSATDPSPEPGAALETLESSAPQQASQPASSTQKEKLRWTKGWKNVKIPPLPGKGDFDIKNVLKSTYFFS